MSSVYSPELEMHTIEAVLYPNHLQTSGPGTYLAKNTKEKTIGIEVVCGAMKTRRAMTVATRTRSRRSTISSKR